VTPGENSLRTRADRRVFIAARHFQYPATASASSEGSFFVIRPRDSGTAQSLLGRISEQHDVGTSVVECHTGDDMAVAWSYDRPRRR
jgi:hypothetical protein